MAKAVKTLIVLAIIALSVSLIAVMFSANTKPVKQEVKQGQEQIKLFGTVLINESKHFSSADKIPLYIQCILENPLKDKQIELINSRDMYPVICDKEDKSIQASFEILAPEVAAVPAGDISIITWLVDTELNAGKYKISCNLKPDNAGIKDCIIEKIKIFPAILIISGEKADKKDIEYHQRRIVMLKGNLEEYLKEVQNALTDSPEDTGLQIELADALEMTGRYQEAKQQILTMARQIQQNQLGNDSSKNPDFPDWIPFTLERLNKKL